MILFNKMVSVNTKIIFVLVPIIAFVLCKYYGIVSFFDTDNKHNDRVILSQEDLSKYNGIVHERLYLAVLGHIFDVTDGSKHYKQGSSYNYFIGW